MVRVQQRQKGEAEKARIGDHRPQQGLVIFLMHVHSFSCMELDKACELIQFNASCACCVCIVLHVLLFALCVLVCCACLFVV